MLKVGDERSVQVKTVLDALVTARQTEHWNAAEEPARQLVGWVAECSKRPREMPEPTVGEATAVAPESMRSDDERFG
jgi:hypothetical protein